MTLRTRSPIPRDELLPILESLLHNHGALMVRAPIIRLFISGAQNASRMAPAFKVLQGLARVIPMSLCRCSTLARPRWLRFSSQSRLTAALFALILSAILLVLAGTQMQIEGWLDIVTTFDIDQLAGTSVGVFPIQRGTVEDVFIELEHILNTAEGGVTGLASMVRVLPVERLNSILVVSPRAAYIEMVGNWVEQLDSIDEPASESTLHVYEVLNGNAAKWRCC